MKEAISNNENNVQAWNLFGLCSISLGNIEEGLEAYNKALKLDPTFRDAWFNLCQAHKEVILIYILILVILIL